MHLSPVYQKDFQLKMFPIKTCYGNALSSTTYLVQRKTGKKGVARENKTFVGSKLGEVLKCGDDL